MAPQTLQKPLLKLIFKAKLNNWHVVKDIPLPWPKTEKSGLGDTEEDHPFSDAAGSEFITPWEPDLVPHHQLQLKSTFQMFNKSAPAEISL